MLHAPTRFLRLLIAVAALVVPVAAQGLDLPAPSGFVDDFAGVIDAPNRERLETICQNFRDRTQIDVAVVTLDSLQGRSIEDVGLQIGREWHVGAGQDKDGVVLLLAVQDRRSRIEVSRHLEDEITDAASGSILRKARPMFANGSYGAGLEVMTESVLATIADKRGITIDGIDRQMAYRGQPRTQSGSSWVSRIIFLGILVALIAAFARGGGGGYGGRRRRGGISPWLLLGLFSGGRGGGWGGGSGGGWGGGSDGGGWGGFGGGGDFGGGGASDSW